MYSVLQLNNNLKFQVKFNSRKKKGNKSLLNTVYKPGYVKVTPQKAGPINKRKLTKT